MSRLEEISYFSFNFSTTKGSSNTAVTSPTSEAKDAIDMNLFEDKDDAKVTKARKGDEPEIRGNGIEPHVSEDNPMMKSYLEAVAKA